MQNNIAALFDHTLLKQTATRSEIAKLCEEARQWNFFSVCVNPFWVDACTTFLSGSNVKVCSVVGFPLGANLTQSKLDETQHVLARGAQEIDVVINVGALKSGDTYVVQQELRQLVEICRDRATLKVIVESGQLTQDELSRAIDLVSESEADFIKTSTGFSTPGATPAAIQLMRSRGRPGLKIKASGGIRTAQDFETYRKLGVDRIGASQSVEILKALGQAL